MDFLTGKEVAGIRRDLRNGEAMQEAGKTGFERKLLGGLGKDMEETLERPDRSRDRKIARRYAKRKRLAVWKENLRRIFRGKG